MGKVAERRARTIDTIVGAALDVMAADGAAGLTLGEVARRVGMRTPSLYGYFDSRAALCDEIFARGWRDVQDAIHHITVAPGRDLEAVTAEGMRVVVAWALEHPASAQLMFWRPIAGWQPSAAAFAPALAVMEHTVRVIADAQGFGQVDPAHDPADVAQVYAALGAGVISQQLSNEPGVPLAEGRASRQIDALVRMFVDHYSPRSAT